MSAAPMAEVTLALRRKQKLPGPHQAVAKSSLAQRRHLDHEEFSALYASSPEDLQRVRSFAKRFGLKVVEESGERRSMVVAGSRSQIARAFGPAEKGPDIPQELAEVVEMVLRANSGAKKPLNKFSRREGASETTKKAPLRTARVASAQGSRRSRSVLDLARAYEFPEGPDGSGECIALIELGGGFHQRDIEDFCASLNIPPPRISCVFLHGAKNRPATAARIKEFLDVAEGRRKLSDVPREHLEAAQCTIEVTMDVEIAAALAPGARIVVYFAPMSEQGIHAAFARAIHDREHRPSVISYSWGEAENRVSDKFAQLIDEALQAAAHLGITVCASSGDQGSRNDSADHLPTVNFPASSLYCMGCGGTTTSFADDEITILDESVWNSSHYGIKGATGGGVSRKFPLPAWQRRAQVPDGPTGEPGRGVPDVAGPADPRSGCEILVAGQRCTSSGTSSVVPLWAALIARCNHALGARCGYFLPLLYKLAARPSAKAFRVVRHGDNGAYKARDGWSACTGLGTPRGKYLLKALRGKR